MPIRIQRKRSKATDMGKILDGDGVEVMAGCTVGFSYGTPPVGVIAPVIERDGKLIAITEGHRPSECEVRLLKAHVGYFYVRKE